MRVTLGIATYNRATYLAESVAAALAQDFGDFEVLVVDDGSTNPEIAAVLESFDDDRLRIVRHEHNRGIAAAYNSFFQYGKGDLIAMVGDDDVCLPDRLSRQVAVFERWPEVGVVHGDAVIIDAAGRELGAWNGPDALAVKLLHMLVRRHNLFVDPTRMVHRRVYEAIGGYDDAYPLANDFDFWLRAVPRFSFRRCEGGPLVRVRRHGENTSQDGVSRAQEVADVERALEACIEREGLRVLVPELDWAVLDERAGERTALLALAGLMERRELPLPGLAARLRERAGAIRVPVRRREANARSLLMTSFGFNEPGGGTTVPRLAAKELARRGWDVTVFHAGVAPTPGGRPYEIVRSEQDGVRLVGVHNRPSALFDPLHPERELDDPPIAAAFAALLDAQRPDVVHFHNLHNLGASLMDHAFARGLPAYFTTHNYWLICPRAYLMTGNGEMCPGPADRGGACAACVGGREPERYQQRLAEIRARALRSLRAVLAVSDSVRRTLLAQGYPPELVDVVRQAMPHEGEIWSEVGAEREPGRLRDDELIVGFLGSAYPHKGPQLLVQAAQRCHARVRVRVHGEVPVDFAQRLMAMDRRGVVELCGAFAPSEIGRLLARVDVAVLPSLWWDCAPLAAAECRAARVPLIVPRLGGLPEAVRDGVDGLTFEGLSADDLAACIDRVATEPGLLERMQAAIEPPRAFSDYVDELEAYYAGQRPSAIAGAGDGPLALRWQGEHGRALSLSIINDQVSRRLQDGGMLIERVGLDGHRVEGSPPLPHAADVEVRHQWPPDLRGAPAGRLAVIQPWEFGAIPSAWLKGLRRDVDELWVPSEHVRAMYLGAGMPAERVVVVPNGVDLSLFAPRTNAGAGASASGSARRFLFVGGLVWRKGHDVLLDAWRRAFAGRDDVTLVVKDVGAEDVYRGGDRDAMRAYAASGELPRVELISDELSGAELADLYRSCDVLVHPYRGEGFAMPVLEAMACGLPAIVTAGGPTDEFCPDAACWRIRSQRAEFPDDRVDSLPTAGRPWVLEPSADHLAQLLRDAAQADDLAARGRAARAAAERFDWDRVAGLYRARIEALATRPPLLAAPLNADPYPLSGSYALRLLATPAWRGEDRLGDLLRAWVGATVAGGDACLHLLADPAVDGEPSELEARVLTAADAAGVALDGCGDIDVVMEPLSGDRDARLHRAVDAYVPLHAACTGHERLARAAGNAVLGVEEVAAFVSGVAAAA